jgi:hypothetical protein
MLSPTEVAASAVFSRDSLIALRVSPLVIVSGCV